MEEIWTGLTQEERRTLSEVQKRRVQDVGGQHRHALGSLATKGLVRRMDAGWCVFADLFAAYVADAEGESNGKIWLDETTDELYQDRTVLGDLSPLERAVLHFLVQHPRIRHAKTDLIVNTWPDELRRQGVTDDSLYQVIRELRKRIEPNPAKPCYIVTWRGRPEGGYQFFPEGRPG
jgi:DNA-binding response OmpR family regulator